MPHHETIGAHDAKTRLSGFLRKVQAGGRFTITQRGRPVAALVPLEEDDIPRRVQAAQTLRQLMADAPGRGDVDIKALVESGRD
ncbi:MULTISPECIES: type II toxin-antitoxin system Phd/YefM family antitoxin [unclassified Thioalkalivibrio]|uniref:type II toxin-antitoxin system Phd/YefM family antitoxin n=1 Tax=unclassified Thioalkalivibrio TaxID=2621013 RepID=UPI00036B287E|nr:MULTISPECIES: type II toxin-antitoxin system prevent-host-death family antitoxin [unclassified Thioalkalivibrio]